MLDLLPAELWSNPNAKFLDPVSKSGVFLREMAKRLMKGLDTQIPDQQQRINHIFSQQLYGIAITDLTALISRRSVYCSKTANSKYSICNTFSDEQGNIRYQPMQHTWANGKCTFCGASQEVYNRDDALETYAYNFIHTNKPEEIFNMKFDVIVGNPPYQLSDGGDNNEEARTRGGAIPLYHKFVQQAKKLNPRYLTMITPARWYAGGKGLDEFRKTMLADKRIRKITDFHNAADCFPGVEIKGGVCYFLWEKDNQGLCEITSVINNQRTPAMARDISQYDVLVRPNEAISILEKVQAFAENTFDTKMSSRKPFGFPTNFINFHKKQKENDIKIYANNNVGFIESDKIKQGIKLIKPQKIIISKAYNGGYTYPHQIIGKPIITGENSCCTETYIVCDVLDNNVQAKNLSDYICTRFFRFMVFLRKISQDNPKDRFLFVPIQNYNEPWTDEKLYAKYGLTEDEIAFIESMIRPMSESGFSGLKDEQDVKNE